MASEAIAPTPKRRSYSPELKSQVVAQTQMPGATGRCASRARASHPDRTQARRHSHQRGLAGRGSRRIRSLDARAAAVIRIDALWLAIDPLDMRAGTDTALARVVQVFGAAHPHTAYLFTNRRTNRMKVLVHDGIGIWLAARRLHQGHFVWPASPGARQLTISHAQLDALVLGLPWQRIGAEGIITVV